MKISGVVLLLFIDMLAAAQTGSRRAQNDKNAYRDVYQRVSAGGNYTLEIRNGAIWAYGNNTDGQLGLGNNTSSTIAGKAGVNSDWMALSAGTSHSVGIRADGTLWAWGQNLHGALGDGTNNSRNVPVQVGAAANWISAVAGNNHSLGLKADGTLWAWGNNSHGQLGDATTTNRNTPVQVGSGNTWVSVSAGNEISAALKADGTLWAWGNNTNGYLGDGTLVDRTTPVQIGVSDNWVNITSCYNHTLGLQANGTLWAWGANASMQLGDGTTVDRLQPVQVGTQHNWTDISTGVTHSLALKADGSLWAWGDNQYGQVGNGTTVAATLPVQVAAGTKWVAVEAGHYHSTALSADGNLQVWGEGTFGQLGDTVAATRLAPVIRSKVVNWVKVTPGANFTIGLKSDGSLWAFGYNAWGQLGTGTLVGERLPVKVGNAVWVDIAAGIDFSMGIQSDGTLWAWGRNYFGAIGDGTTTDRWLPVQISTSTDWVAVTGGGVHAMALKADGTLWTWGDNTNGALGGNNGSNKVPMQMDTATDWVRIEAGGLSADHSLAIKANGTLWAWGSNSAGQLGDGTGFSRSAPVKIGSAANWIAISGGQAHTIALKADGTLWTWGLNVYGNLGNGSNTNTYSPVQIAVNTANWIKITAGTHHNSGLQANGSLWAWGYNFSGQLGDASNSDKTNPVAVVPGTGWGDIGAGSQANSSLGLKPDRLTYCTTGANNLFQLGDSTTIQRNTYNCKSILVPEPPSVDFRASDTVVCVGSTVNFTDQSTGLPTTWQWDFTGGTPGSSTGRNPTVTYNTTGTYSVKLVITNAYGADSITRIAYIKVVTTPVAGVISSTPDTVCAGKSAQLVVTGASGSVQWQQSTNGILFTDIPGANQPGYMATGIAQATYYRVKITGNCGTGFSDSIQVLILPLPVAGVLSGNPDTLCTGQSSVVSVTGAQGAIQWQLSADGISFSDIPAATLSTYNTDSLAQSTYFRVKVSAECGTDSSAAISVTVNPLPFATVTATDSLICSGDSTQVCVNGTFSKYEWNTAETTPCIQARAAGGYWLTITDANGCSALSGRDNIAVYPVSSVSVIIKGDTLTSFNAVSYQWYLNDTLIPGATSAMYIAEKAGNYSVEVTDTNGCKALSNQFGIVKNNITAITGSSCYSVYPNPVTNVLFINAAGSATVLNSIELYDLVGRLVVTERPGTVLPVMLNMEMLQPGCYYLKLMWGEGDYITKLIKK